MHKKSTWLRFLLLVMSFVLLALVVYLWDFHYKICRAPLEIWTGKIGQEGAWKRE